MSLQQLINYDFENLNYEKDEDQYIPKTDVVFVLKNVLIDNIFYFNKDKSKIPKASIVIDKHMKNKLKELYNKKPSKLTPDPYYRKFMNKHTLRLTLNTTYTEIYDKSTKEYLNDQEGIVDSLKGKLVDVIIAHEGITTFKKSKKNDGNNVFGIFTLQQIYVLDTQNDELNNKKISGFQEV